MDGPPPSSPSPASTRDVPAAFHLLAKPTGAVCNLDCERRLAALRANARVEWNALTTIHAANAQHGREVCRFLRDECGARFVQFIPIIERVAEAAEHGSVPWTSCRDRPCTCRRAST